MAKYIPPRRQRTRCFTIGQFMMRRILKDLKNARKENDYFIVMLSISDGSFDGFIKCLRTGSVGVRELNDM